MVTSIADVVLELAQNVSLLALVVVGYAGLKRYEIGPRYAMQIAIGALFALGVVLAMSLRVSAGQGAFLDGRNVMIGLVATFGGPIATAVTVAVAVLYRLWLGGASAPSGAIGSIAAALIGIAFAAARDRRLFRLNGMALLALGACVVTVGFINAVLFNPVITHDSLQLTALALYLVIPISTAILGLALTAEDERLTLQARLRDQTDLFEAIFNSMSDGVAVANTRGEIIMANPMARKLWGNSALNAEGRARVGDFKILDLDGQIPFPKERLPLKRALSGEETNNIEMIFGSEAAEQRRVSVNGRPLRDIKGRMRGGVIVFNDITQTRKMQETLQRSEERLNEAIESIPEGFVLLDAELRIVKFNQRMAELYPLSASALQVGRPLADMLQQGAEQGEYPRLRTEADIGRFVETWMARFRGDTPYFGEGAFNDGRWVLVSHRRTTGGDFVSVRTDITAQKQRERELANLLEDLIQAQAATERAHRESQRMERMLRAITNAVPALVAYLNTDERYEYCNKEYEDVFGINPASMLGRRIEELNDPDIYAVVKPHVTVALAGVESAFVRPMIAKGETRYVEQRYIPEKDLDGKVTGFYAIAWDITDHHRRAAELNAEATTDVLTGLLNRRAALQALSEAVSLWAIGEANGAVLYLDIDHFKEINDTLGHDAGDALLKIFSERIRSSIRASDKVARLGGDEFVIILTAPNAEEIAERVARTVLDKVQRPAKLGDRDVAISTSVGIAISVKGIDLQAERILKEADLALYEAKQGGRNRFAVRKMM
ncbi:MAG TPA: diguanylate cyclase [Dongiaceae bacterium]